MYCFLQVHLCRFIVMKDNKKTYPPNWVVMQNNIQECFKSMNIDEKRMLILASQLQEQLMQQKKIKSNHG